MADLEKLTFYALESPQQGHSNRWDLIAIVNQQNIVEQTFRIKGKVKSLYEDNGKVIAASNKRVLKWDLNNMNNSPEITYHSGLIDFYHEPLSTESYSKASAYMKCKVLAPKATMKITPLGIGNADPKTPLGNSCFLLEADERYLIDFPRVLPSDKRLNDIKNVFITHTHNDHLGSLVDFLLMRGPKEKAEERVNLYAEKFVGEKLRGLLEDLGLKTVWSKPSKLVKLADFANLVFLSHNRYNKRINDLHVDVCINNHGSTVSTGFIFDYGCKKIAISGDGNIGYLAHMLEKEDDFSPVVRNMRNSMNLLTFKDRQYVYECCDLIFQEATMVPNPTHTHIEFLEQNLKDPKSNVFLYHVEKDLVSRVFPIACKGRTYRV